MAPSVGKAFIKAVVGEQGNGYFQTDSLSGSHIVQVLERTAPVKKYKVAELSMAVNPSTETYTDLYNGLSSYISKNNDAKSFSESAKEKMCIRDSNSEPGIFLYASRSKRDTRYGSES